MVGEVNFALLDPNMPAKVGTSWIQGAQQARQDTAQELQNQAALLQNQNALAEAEAYKAAGGDYNKLQQELMSRGQGKAALGVAKQVSEIEKAGLETRLKKVELNRETFSNLRFNPSDENVLAHLQDQILRKDITPQQAEGMYAHILGMDPKQRVIYFTEMGAKADTAYKELKLQGRHEDEMGIKRGQLGVAQGQLALGQQRFDLTKQNTVSPEAQDLISTAILEGRLDPNKVNSRNRSVIAATLMADPNANLRQLGEEAAGGLAGARSIGTQEANVAMAASEARKMITLADRYSTAVDRTQYPSINAISNAVAKGTGDQNIVQLNTAINSLVNVYARAINPKGVATVSDKTHARELINAAYSNGQLSSIMQVMDQEMAAAQSAGKEARKVLRGGKTELSGEDKAAADWAKANPNDPRAAKIRQKLGL